MNKSRLDLLTERLIDSLKNMGDEDMTMWEAELKLKDVGFPTWTNLKQTAVVLREFAIGKRMDKLQRMLWSKELKEKEVEKEMKVLLEELVENEKI
jgi:hypothetical protein